MTAAVAMVVASACAQKKRLTRGFPAGEWRPAEKVDPSRIYYEQRFARRFGEPRVLVEKEAPTAISFIVRDLVCFSPGFAYLQRAKKEEKPKRVTIIRELYILEIK
jgi:hypothetical protein